MTEWSYHFPDVMARILKHWPERIDVTERIGESPLEGYGMRFPALSEAEKRAEDALEAQGDEIAAMVNWKLFTALHNVARRQSVVFPHLIHHGYVKALFEKNLGTDILEGLEEEYRKQNALPD